ncbi:MAG: phenylalanine--tRNA ligase subunit alpha, partial [Terriglobales bacterium]
MASHAEHAQILAAKSWAAVVAEYAPQSAEDFDQRLLQPLRQALEAGEADRAFWFSRERGILTLIADNWLKAAGPDWKPIVGRGLNLLKQSAEAHFAAEERRQAAAAAQDRRRAERVDITLPGRPAHAAPAHPVLQVRDEIAGIFLRLGYRVADGPEIETAYYNFEALNIPEGHPAREEQDTLYLGPGLQGYLLRTHTSPVQIRTMERQHPPLRVIVPGKAYRRDAPDATHSPSFHQIEGLAVDTGLQFGDLKG